MFRFASLVLTVVAAIASLSCQTYSTGLEQSIVRADETAATAALRTIALAQQTYSVTNNGQYGTFPQLCAGGYLDSRFNSDKPTLKDYVLTMEVGRDSDGPYFKSNADPSGAAKGRHFFVDASAAIRVNPTEPAGIVDPVYRP